MDNKIQRETVIMATQTLDNRTNKIAHTGKKQPKKQQQQQNTEITSAAYCPLRLKNSGI